jgi:hypothetical protein
VGTLNFKGLSAGSYQTRFFFNDGCTLEVSCDFTVEQQQDQEKAAVDHTGHPAGECGYLVCSATAFFSTCYSPCRAGQFGYLSGRLSKLLWLPAKDYTA